MSHAGFIPVFLLEQSITKEEFRSEMERLWEKLPRRSFVEGRSRIGRFGTHEQWEKFLIFEDIERSTGFGRRKVSELTIERVRGELDMRANQRDFEHAIDYVQELIDTMLSSSTALILPENKKWSGKKRP